MSKQKQQKECSGIFQQGLRTKEDYLQHLGLAKVQFVHWKKRKKERKKKGKKKRKKKEGR